MAARRDGFTLIEVLASLVILLTAFTVLAELFSGLLRAETSSKYQREGWLLMHRIATCDLLGQPIEEFVPETTGTWILREEETEFKQEGQPTKTYREWFLSPADDQSVLFRFGAKPSR